MITKEISYDHQIDESGNINVREITRIMEEGVEISKSYHRHVVAPGDDITNENITCQQLSCTVHTDEVIIAHIERAARLKAEMAGGLSAEKEAELAEIKEDLEEASIVSEGETVEGEAEKKATAWARLKAWWSEGFK